MGLGLSSTGLINMETCQYQVHGYKAKYYSALSISIYYISNLFIFRTIEPTFILWRINVLNKLMQQKRYSTVGNDYLVF